MRGDILFFFSSRRRHTRLQGDWSSDVCSSDLERAVHVELDRAHRKPWVATAIVPAGCEQLLGVRGRPTDRGVDPKLDARSEERRVGTECKSRGAAAQSRRGRRKTKKQEKTETW